MPHATVRFRFEWKVFELAHDLVERYQPPGHKPDPHQPWLFLLAANATVEARTGSRRKDVEALIQQAKAAGRAYVFFHPFDFPEYAWVEWDEVDRVTMESLLGRPFEDHDFVAGNTRQSWPETWGVMF